MKKYYFLGIGGTAMGAVAGAMSNMGIEVTGSDERLYAPMSTYLADSGIRYCEGYDARHIEHEKPDVIVVGNAISRGNEELEYALEHRIRLVAMPDVVREHLIGKHTSVVISGTHGKTTTTSLTAWLLEAGGKQPGFLVGGIAQNFGYGCRAVPVSVRGSEQAFFVSEGDEYDTAFFDKRSKFLLYRPDIAVINNLEFDHADIFASLEDIKRSFSLFSRLVPRNGVILVASGESDAQEVATKGLAPIETFGVDAGAFWRAVEMEITGQRTSFTLLRSEKEVGRFTLPLTGVHNVKNAVAALAIGWRAGISPELLQQGLETFQAPKRRMEVLYDDGITVIDDFAHHPTAIAATLEAVAHSYPNRRIIACFEPRSNSTTRNIFQNELATCFEKAAVVVFGAVNRPERYQRDEVLDIDMLTRELVQQGKQVMHISLEKAGNADWGSHLVAYLCAVVQKNDVIVLMSNGNFGNIRQELLQALQL